VVEDTSYTLTLGTVTDPGTDTVTSYVVHWGDGNSTTYGSAGNVTHTYADPGDYTISVDLVDEDGTFTNAGSKALTVNTASATLSVEAGADTSLAEGGTLSRTVAFSDGADNGAAGWGYSIDYGDGTTVNGTTLVKSVELSHQYTDGDANRTVTLTLTDEAGETANDSFLVTVNNVAPTAPVTGADTVAEGSLYTLSVGAVSDPGADTRTGYSINWGDGTVQNLTPAEWTTAAGNFTHTYADGGAGGTARTVTVSATDEDGTFVLGSKSLTVNNVAPLIALAGAGSIAEGASYTLTLGAVTDPGTETVTSYVVHWGDGNSDTYSAGGDVTHVYADGAASPTITVDLVDEDGTHTNAGAKSITVTNVAPTASVTGADTVAEGSVYALSVGAVSDPGTDTRTGYSIDWGDGTVQNLTSAEWTAAAGSFTHVFTDDENGPVNATPRTVTVSATDEDGTFTLGSKSLTVNNVAPTIALAGANSVVEDTSYTLTLGAVTDPGTDTVTSYVVNWGDGSSNTYGGAGNVTHTYADPADYTISVDLLDEDGTFLNAGSKALTVNAASANLSVEAGADTSLNEGGTLSRTVAFSDGADNGAAGWGYSIDYGDGTTVNGTTLVKSVELSHQYADGAANRTVTVTLTDEAGETASDSFAVTVNNVAPTASVTGADTVDEGTSYTLNVGAVSDPGADTRTGYSINWGDGTVQNLTPAEWTTAAGSFTHTYADGGAGGTARTVTVSATDEDGTFVLGSRSLTVNNVAPLIALAGAASIAEGASYTLTLGAVTDPGTETVTSYVVHWGDGNSDTYSTGGDVTHVYADGAASPTITVDLVDEDGTHTNAGAKSISVNNVAPTIALGGAASVNEGATYTLTLGAVTDPGTDTVTSYLVDWGDGSNISYAAAGDVTHVYADGAGDINRTISVSLVDEDGTHSGAGSKEITVNDVPAPTIIHLGDASGIATTLNPYVWAPFWTDAGVDIRHKANLANAGEAWTAVKLSALSATTLPGGDLYGGDLGVSGKNLGTSTISQEISGAEALRFDLDSEATKATVDLSRFFRDDDANVFNYNEAGRVQALDADGNVVAEQTFFANSSTGTQTVTLEYEEGFSVLVVTAGAYNGGNFVFGAYANDAGGFAAAPYNNGKLHGSDFLLDSIEFELVTVIGVNPDQGLPI
jgi:hypothetical protein